MGVWPGHSQMQETIKNAEDADREKKVVNFA